MKKGMILLFLVFSIFVLSGCDMFSSSVDEEEISYDTWRNTEEALDLNGDKKINEEDFKLFLEEDSYKTWRDSENALDLNDDRKIDENDYDLYLSQGDFDSWKNSEEAIDLNGDRRIDEDDFLLFQNSDGYDEWRNSENALDLNNDQRINEDDYFLYQTQNDYDTWKLSSKATDYNGDRKIDENDYLLYQDYMVFAGNYYIDNFVYVGSEYNHIFGAERISVPEFGDLIMQMTLNIGLDGIITLNMPSNVILTLGDLYNNFSEAADNMSINRISPFIVGIDTSVVVEGITFNYTLYFEKIENGYTTSYIIGFYDDNPLITFDVIKVD